LLWCFPCRGSNTGLSWPSPARRWLIRPPADVGRLLLAGEASPGGLPGHAERGADALPGDTAVAQSADPFAQALLDLVLDRGDTRNVLQDLLVGHALRGHVGFRPLHRLVFDDG